MKKGQGASNRKTVFEALYGNPRDLEAVIAQVGSMTLRELSAARQAVAASPTATVPRLGSKIVSRRAASPAASTVDENFEATDDQGVPKLRPADSLQQVVQQIADSVEKLKKMLPADDTTGDDDVEAGKAAARGGRFQAAADLFNSALAAVCGKLKTRNASTALRAEPSSRSRACKLTSSGFNAMPSVAALNASLGRGGSLSLSDRAGVVLAAVAGHREPAPAASIATASASGYSRAREIQAQIADNEKEQRKFGFTNERNQKHGELSRQLKAEMKKLRPQ
jgi:hypothetical protein